MTHNGIAVDQIQAFVQLMRSTPQAGAATTRSRHRWDGGTSVEWDAGTITVGGQPIERDHHIRVDLPKELGGNGSGPAPGEILAAALGACVARRFVEEAALRGVDLDGVDIDCETDLDLRGTYQLGSARPGLSDVRVTVSVRSEADDAVLDELLQTAVATSPIADSVANPVPVRPALRRPA